MDAVYAWISMHQGLTISVLMALVWIAIFIAGWRRDRDHYDCEKCDGLGYRSSGIDGCGACGGTGRTPRT